MNTLTNYESLVSASSPEAMAELLEEFGVSLEWLDSPMVEKSYELKPCPFCGSDAMITEFNDSYYVECESCCATTGECVTIKEAVMSWNRRLDDVDENAPYRAPYVPVGDAF